MPFQFFFVSLQSLSRAKAVSKKSIVILSLSIKSANFKKEEEHLCFRLVVYAIFTSIPSGVRYVPKVIRSVKGVWRYLKENDMSTYPHAFSYCVMINIPLEVTDRFVRLRNGSS